MTEAVEELSPITSESKRQPSFKRYVGALALGVTTAFAFLGGTFVLLAETENLPPPAISNNLCIDEKLAFMRENPPKDPNFLVMGSSVAWRHIDSSILAASMPGTVPYNAAFCALQMTQTFSVTQWLLGRLPTVRHLLVVASPQDFESCSREPLTTFSLAEADRFVFERPWRWGYYFRFFDPVSLVRNAVSIKQLRTQEHALETLRITKYGDAPQDPPKPKEHLVYDAIEQFDPLCFHALRALALEMQSKGIALTVVNTPLNPLWEKTYDPDAKTHVELNNRIETVLAGTGAVHFNGDIAFTEGPDSFTDAIQLRWPAAQRFTKLLIETSLSHRDVSLSK
jgi:hypothetical protein